MKSTTFGNIAACVGTTLWLGVLWALGMHNIAFIIGTFAVPACAYNVLHPEPQASNEAVVPQ